MDFAFWRTWLLIVAVLITLFGVAIACLSGTPLFDLFNHQIDPAFWNASAPANEAKEFQKWIYGAWGAIIAGWGIFFVFITRYAFEKKEKWIWNCIAVGLLVWFVLDTGLSLNYRVYFNVVFNSILLIVTGLPILFTRKYFA